MRNIASKGSCQHRHIAEDASVSKGFTARKDLWRNWQVLIFVTDWWHYTHSTTLENFWFLRGCVGLSVLYTYDHWLCLCQEGQEFCGSLKPSNTDINFPRWYLLSDDLSGSCLGACSYQGWCGCRYCFYTFAILSSK